MIVKSIKALFFVCGFFCALWLSGSGCGKDPTSPPPAEETDYVFYMGDELMTNKYFAYHTKTGAVDSFTLPYACYNSGLVASPDGKKLYLNPPGKIVEVSTDSLTVMAEYSIPVSREYTPVFLAISDDGRYLASCKLDLIIFDLSDCSIAYRDTAYHQYPVFAKSTHHLYSAKHTNGQISYYHIIDCDNGFADTAKGFDYGAATKIVPDIGDENRWYILLSIGSGAYLFQVYDFALDSVLFNKAIIPGHGDIVQTPDGNTVFFSQPDSKWMPSGNAPCFMSQFNCHTRDGISEIYTKADSTTYYGLVCPINELCITPDGHRIIGTNLLWGQLFDYDIRTQEFIRRLEFCRYFEPLNLTCQTLQ